MAATLGTTLAALLLLSFVFFILETAHRRCSWSMVPKGLLDRHRLLVLRTADYARHLANGDPASLSATGRCRRGHRRRTASQGVRRIRSHQPPGRLAADDRSPAAGGFDRLLGPSAVSSRSVVAVSRRPSQLGRTGLAVERARASGEHAGDEPASGDPAAVRRLQSVRRGISGATAHALRRLPACPHRLDVWPRRTRDRVTGLSSLASLAGAGGDRQEFRGAVRVLGCALRHLLPAAGSGAPVTSGLRHQCRQASLRN